MTAETTSILLNVAVLGFIGWLGLEMMKLRKENSELFAKVREEMSSGEKQLASIDQAFKGYDGEGGLLADIRTLRRHNHDTAAFYMVAADQLHNLNRFAVEAAPKIGVAFTHPGPVPLALLPDRQR